jgi:hypothetical protein
MQQIKSNQNQSFCRVRVDLVVDIVSVVLVVNILSVHNKTTNLDSAYQNYLDLGPPSIRLRQITFTSVLV